MAAHAAEFGGDEDGGETVDDPGKDPDGPKLGFTPGAWSAFLAGTKADRLGR